MPRCNSANPECSPYQMDAPILVRFRGLHRIRNIAQWRGGGKFAIIHRIN